MSTPPADQPSRDFVGYGREPPDPRWPHGARVAVNFVVNYEEGSEYSIPDGDGLSEAGLTESTSSPIGPGVRNLAGETMFEYGSRVGSLNMVRPSWSARAAKRGRTACSPA